MTSTRRGRTGVENSTAPLWLSHAAWVSLPCLSPFVLRNTLSRCFGGRTQLVERACSAALLAERISVPFWHTGKGHAIQVSFYWLGYNGGIAGKVANVQGPASSVTFLLH